jgi:hypothetical protein
MKYYINRIRLLKQNGHTEVLKTIVCEVHVSDLEAYREKLKAEHGVNRVHFNYTEVK